MSVCLVDEELVSTPVTIKGSQTFLVSCAELLLCVTCFTAFTQHSHLTFTLHHNDYTIFWKNKAHILCKHCIALFILSFCCIRYAWLLQYMLCFVCSLILYIVIHRNTKFLVCKTYLAINMILTNIISSSLGHEQTYIQFLLWNTESLIYLL